MLTNNSVRALLAAAALALSACATNPSSPPEVLTPEPAAEPEPVVVVPDIEQPPTGPDLASITLSIAGVGDMMLGSDFPSNRLPDDDAHGFLAGVTDILSAVDIAFGNVEGVLMDGGTPAKKCSNPAACYLFRSPTRYAARFKAAGFDALSFANNHARDFGEEGRLSSMQAVAALGMVHSGLEGDIAQWQVNGVRVAMIAFAVTKNSNMMLNVERSALSVAKLAQDNDVVIVSFHGGAEGLGALHIPFAEEEYYEEPRGDVVVFARTMVDVGADVVFGHGPHVVRAMERYNNRLIAYSLGNFATYYGISVGGLKGVAPIVVVNVDGNGEFLGGKIHSTVQQRPAGPSIDPSSRALHKIRELSMADFVEPGLNFDADGVISAAPRNFVRATTDTISED